MGDRALGDGAPAKSGGALSPNRLDLWKRALSPILCVCALAQVQRPPDISAGGVARAAQRYVDEYQHALSFLLAEEAGSQQVLGQQGGPVGRRTTKAEIFLTFLDKERVWLAVRDVFAVDGEPVSDHVDLRSLLTSGPLSGLAQVLANQSSRFNIGSIGRNFNEPTLGLLVLDAGHRSQFKFERRRVEQVGDAMLVTLGFTETERPTLIHGVDNANVYSKGELIVEAGTGRVRRTFIELKQQEFHVQLTTTYRLDERLDIWVPDVFTERYERSATRKDAAETITCESTYSNYRKFDVQIRIK